MDKDIKPEDILRYLYEEEAFFDYIDLIVPFADHLEIDQDRFKFKNWLTALQKDGLIEISKDSRHRSIDDKYANKLDPISSLIVKARLTGKGREHVNQSFMLIKAQNNTAPTAIPIKKNSPKKNKHSDILALIIITVAGGVITWFITSYLGKWLQ